MSQSQFPRVTRDLDAGGESVEYASCCERRLPPVARRPYGHRRRCTRRRSAKGTSHREKAHQAAAGRPQQQRALRRRRSRSGPRAAPPRATLLLINPNPKDRLSADAMGRDRNFVSKTVCIGKEFLPHGIPPAGES